MNNQNKKPAGKEPKPAKMKKAKPIPDISVPHINKVPPVRLIPGEISF